MPCIMGPIPQSAVSGYVQVQINYNSGLAFVLAADGTCRVDLAKLIAFANPPGGGADTGVYLARSVLAAWGHPVAERPDDAPAGLHRP